MTEENIENVNVEDVENQTEESTEQTSNEPKTFTQDELNGILEDRLNRQAKQFNKKIEEATTKAVDEYKASIKEDERLSKLSEKERLSEELEQAQAQIKELQAVQQRNDMLKASREELSKRNLNVDDRLLEILTTHEADSTMANIDAFEEYTNKARQMWAEERSKGKTPTVSNEDNEPVDPFSQAIASIK